MDNGKELSAEIRKALEQITREKGYMLEGEEKEQEDSHHSLQEDELFSDIMGEDDDLADYMTERGDNSTDEILGGEEESLFYDITHREKPDSQKRDEHLSYRIIKEFLNLQKDEIGMSKNLLSSVMMMGNHLINDGLIQIFRELGGDPRQKMVLRLYLNMQMSSNFLDGFLLGVAFIRILDKKDILAMKDVDMLEAFKRIFLIRTTEKEEIIIKLLDKETFIISHFEKAYRELFTSNSVILKDLTGEHLQDVVKTLIIAFFDGILTARVIAEQRGGK